MYGTLPRQFTLGHTWCACSPATTPIPTVQTVTNSPTWHSPAYTQPHAHPSPLCSRPNTAPWRCASCQHRCRVRGLPPADSAARDYRFEMRLNCSAAHAHRKNATKKRHS